MKKQVTEELRFKIYLPVFYGWYKSTKRKEYIDPLAKKALAQIEKYANKKIKLTDNLLGEIPLIISIIREPIGITHLLNYMFQDNILLKLEFNYSFDFLKFIKEDDDDYTQRNKRQVALKRLEEKIIQAIKIFLIKINIAIPGSMSFGEGLMFMNESLWSRIKSIHTILDEMREDRLEERWPRLKTLDILLVQNYLNKRGYNFNNYSRNKIERAFHCFSYFFGDIEDMNNTEALLLYSMMGIEIIYAQGNLGLAEQIDKKCQLLLGKLKEFKKLLKQLYDFRSRFIHGDLDIAPNHFRFKGDDFEMNEFEVDYNKSTLLSVAILTATLQKLIEKDANQISFQYRYSFK